MKRFGTEVAELAREAVVLVGREDQAVQVCYMAGKPMGHTVEHMFMLTECAFA